MNQIYRWLGTSKQNVHQRLNREVSKNEEIGQMEMVIRQVREDHPEMGSKALYRKIKPTTMGRDKFIEFYREYGFKILPKKSFRRTTDSSGVIRFPNLIEGRELTGVNQIWVSDITYYEMNQKFCYLTLIMDLYSRRIIGFHASKSLRTVDTTIPSLKMAMGRLSEGLPTTKPILHSDGGGQYYSKEFLSLTAGKLRNSMCKNAYENPHAERVNGIIKNSYLRGYNPATFQELKLHLKKAVKMYNNEKPHSALNYRTPTEFESNLKQLYSNNQLPKTVNLI